VCAKFASCEVLVLLITAGFSEHKEDGRYPSVHFPELKNTTPPGMPNPNGIPALQRDPIYFPSTSHKEHVQLENSSIQKDEFSISSRQTTKDGSTTAPSPSASR
jgi:hypothetical protein